jgi:PAS domain S-box-containing protein
VLLAAVLGGEGAGLLALVLALVSAWYLILPPAFSFALERRSDFVNLGLFGLSGALMVLIGGTLRRASDRYSEALARAEAGERRLRLALDAGRLGTAWFDVLRRTGGWSEAVARMLGLPPDKTEVTYEEWLAIVTPEDRPQAEAALAQALRRGDGYYQAEYRIRRPGGEIRTMEFRGTVSHDSAGRPLRLDGVAGDVTERRRAEEALRESDQRLALATAAADLGIWDWTSWAAGWSIRPARRRSTASRRTRRSPTRRSAPRPTRTTWRRPPA